MAGGFELSVRHTGGLKLEAQCGPHRFLMDYPLEPGDAGVGATPLQVLAAALAGCAANAMVALLRKTRQPLEGLEVKVRAQRRAEHPTVLTDIHLTFEVRGPVDPEAAAKALAQSEALICPAWAMLKSGTPISSELKLVG